MECAFLAVNLRNRYPIEQTRRYTAAVLSIIALAITVFADLCRAEEVAIAIIVTPGFDLDIDNADDIARIFRRRLKVAEDNSSIIPINLPLKHPLRAAFSLAVFGVEPEGMEAYWNERYFHGVSPPYVVASIEAMLRFVAATPGAVGYVPECLLDERVSVLLTISLPQGNGDLPKFCTDQHPDAVQKLQTRIAQ